MYVVIANEGIGAPSPVDGSVIDFGDVRNLEADHPNVVARDTEATTNDIGVAFGDVDDWGGRTPVSRFRNALVIYSGLNSNDVTRGQGVGGLLNGTPR